MGRGRLTPPQRHPRRQPRRETETENPRTTHLRTALTGDTRTTHLRTTASCEHTRTALPSRTRLTPEAKTEPNPEAETGTENSPTPQHAKPRTTRSTLHADLGPATPRCEDEHTREPKPEPKPRTEARSENPGRKSCTPEFHPRTVSRTVNRYGSLLPPPRQQEARSMPSWLMRVTHPADPKWKPPKRETEPSPEAAPVTSATHQGHASNHRTGFSNRISNREPKRCARAKV